MISDNDDRVPIRLMSCLLCARCLTSQQHHNLKAELSLAHQQIDEDGDEDAAGGVGGVAQLCQQGLAVQHSYLPQPAAHTQYIQVLLGMSEGAHDISCLASSYCTFDTLLLVVHLHLPPPAARMQPGLVTRSAAPEHHCLQKLGLLVFRLC